MGATFIRIMATTTTATTSNAPNHEEYGKRARDIRERIKSTKHDLYNTIIFVTPPTKLSLWLGARELLS